MTILIKLLLIFFSGYNFRSSLLYVERKKYPAALIFFLFAIFCGYIGANQWISML